MRWKKKWSSQWTQFMQLHKEAWKKFRTSTGFEPVTSRLLVRCSTNWAMKPLTLGAGQLWVHMFPWKKWVLMIYEINHIWTVEMKWKIMKKWSLQWMQFMQLCKEAWKKFRTSTGFEPVTSRYRCNALPTELWSHHWSPEFFFQASLHVHYHPVPQTILKSHYRVCLLLYFYFRRRIFCWEIYDTSLVMRTIMRTLFKKSVTLNKIWHISRTIFNVHIDNTLSIRGIDKILSSREEACLY